MTEAQFIEELRWLGWRTMAASEFCLRPAEAHALGLLIRHPGRVVQLSTLAAYDGDGLSGAKGFSGSHVGVLRRLSRLREKLADLGCEDAVALVDASGGSPAAGSPATGAVMPVADAKRVEEALREAHGVIRITERAA